LHLFLTSSADGGDWSDSHPCHFSTGKRTPIICWVCGWLGPRARLDVLV